MMLRAFSQNDVGILDIHHSVTTSAVRHHHRMGRVLCEKNHLAWTVRCHGCDQRVRSIQYRIAIRRNVLYRDLFDA